jgi:hypothetical protein
MGFLENNILYYYYINVRKNSQESLCSGGIDFSCWIAKEANILLVYLDEIMGGKFRNSINSLAGVSSAQQAKFDVEIISEKGCNAAGEYVRNVI